MRLLTFILISLTLNFPQTRGQVTPNKYKRIYSCNFNHPLRSKHWSIEMDSLPQSFVSAHKGKLILNTKGGVTVWLKKELSGNYQIEYTRKVVMGNGENDRLSDLNMFWMATDPKNSNLFTRKGKFAEYDSLSLYYVGMGGNYNTSTRFRKYQGNGVREIVGENNAPSHLLQPNKEYRIKIVVKNGTSYFWVDDECFFQYTDPHPLTHGWFGFRSTWSHQEIDNLIIYKLN